MISSNTVDLFWLRIRFSRVILAWSSGIGWDKCSDCWCSRDWTVGCLTFPAGHPITDVEKAWQRQERSQHGWQTNGFQFHWVHSDLGRCLRVRSGGKEPRLGSQVGATDAAQATVLRRSTWPFPSQPSFGSFLPTSGTSTRESQDHPSPLWVEERPARAETCGFSGPHLLDSPVGAGQVVRLSWLGWSSLESMFFRGQVLHGLRFHAAGRRKIGSSTSDVGMFVLEPLWRKPKPYLQHLFDANVFEGSCWWYFCSQGEEPGQVGHWSAQIYQSFIKDRVFLEFTHPIFTKNHNDNDS